MPGRLPECSAKGILIGSLTVINFIGDVLFSLLPECAFVLSSFLTESLFPSQFFFNLPGSKPPFLLEIRYDIPSRENTFE